VTGQSVRRPVTGPDVGVALATAATRQLDEGADFVKVYTDGPDTDTSPFTTDEVAKVVALAHARDPTTDPRALSRVWHIA
jgi:hypothetical protein